MNARLILCTSLLLLVVGCLNLKQPAVNIDYYQIEYEPVNPPASKPLDAVLGVRNFTIATAYDSNRLVYREGPFERNTYFYKRWITNPAAMITSSLFKDLQHSRNYLAVAAVPGPTKWDYEIQGFVRDIYENDVGDSWHAVIDLEITCIKGMPMNPKRRVLFQRNYHTSVPCKSKDPKAVVAAMSAAVQEISIELQKDVYKAVQESLKEKVKEKTEKDVKEEVEEAVEEAKELSKRQKEISEKAYKTDVILRE